MKMIPASVLEFKSSAERRVFEMLAQISFGPADVALHSLNIGEHSYKRWGEIDFLLITRRGILALEIKGGRVACRNGIWEYTNRDGKVTRKRESPASQASSAYFALEKNYLLPRFRKDFEGVPSGWALLFEGIDRVVTPGKSTLPELPDQISGYRADCHGHNTLKAAISGFMDYWKSKARGKCDDVPDALIAEIVSYLRPNFEKVPPLNSQLKDFDEELCTLSDEQIGRMDELQENDRISILGGAGTGKTFLAMASARYDAAAGRSVLLVTRSPFLARFLAAHDLPKGIRACCLEDLEAEIRANGRRDVLIVDEGQDLCQSSVLDLLGSAVVGGLEQGRWRWFGDPNNQIGSVFPFEDFAYEYIREHSVVRRLKDNIRNAPPIVESLVSISDCDLGTPRSRGVGSEVKFLNVDSHLEIPARTAKTVARLVSGEAAVSRSDIGILSSNGTMTSALLGELKAANVRAEKLSERALSGQRRDCALVASAQDFKGLERPVIVVAGLGEFKDERMLKQATYAAFSRANHTLLVVCTGEQAKALARLEHEQQKKKHGAVS